jgi:predicted nucleic acid-binding protein
MEKITKPKLFLETTVFNYYSYGKAQKKQECTRKLFEAIDAGEYQAFTSMAVVEELSKDTKEKSENMMSLIGKYHIKTLEPNDEIGRLAMIYIGRKIIPVKYIYDALHIAATTVHGLDCVVSYNMGHIVKPKTMIGTGFINKREGYLPVVISTPEEVIEYDTRTTNR